MTPTWAHESFRPLPKPQNKFEDFNVCQLMAEKAKHDQDYRAQLERSAYGHDKPKELFELNVETEEGMAALRQKYINDENDA